MIVAVVVLPSATGVYQTTTHLVGFFFVPVGVLHGISIHPAPLVLVVIQSHPKLGGFSSGTTQGTCRQAHRSPQIRPRDIEPC